MKKKKIIWICIGSILLLLVAALVINILLRGCTPSSSGTSLSSHEWEGKIRSECLAVETAVEQGIAEAVDIRVSGVTGNTISLTVSAPDICGELTAWLEGISEEEYSNAALEDTIRDLLRETAPQKQEFRLPVEDGTVRYTDEYIQYIGCGLFSFYRKMDEAAAAALGGEGA